MASSKKIWDDAVWSKVIAGAILAAAGVVITYLMNWWPAIAGVVASLFGFLAEASSVPNWLIGIGIVCSVLVLIIAAMILWQAVSPTSGTSREASRGYLTDTFFGLRWRWQYGGDGDIRDLYACCEHCDYQVHAENVSGYDAVPSMLFRCDLCSSTAGPFNEEPFEFESKIRRRIQQKLRTGTWAGNAS